MVKLKTRVQRWRKRAWKRFSRAFLLTLTTTFIIGLVVFKLNLLDMQVLGSIFLASVLVGIVATFMGGDSR